MPYNHLHIYLLSGREVVCLVSDWTKLTDLNVTVTKVPVSSQGLTWVSKRLSESMHCMHMSPTELIYGILILSFAARYGTKLVYCYRKGFVTSFFKTAIPHTQEVHSNCKSPNSITLHKIGTGSCQKSSRMLTGSFLYKVLVLGFRKLLEWHLCLSCNIIFTLKQWMSSFFPL